MLAFDFQNERNNLVGDATMMSKNGAPNLTIYGKTKVKKRDFVII
jgi:hypothetical protein